MIAMPKWTSAAEGEDWAEEDAQAGSGLKEKIREQILAFKASKERGAPAEWAEDDDFIPMNKNAEEDKAAAAAAEEAKELDVFQWNRRRGNMSHTLRLHEEILDFCACMSPRPEAKWRSQEEQQRAELIRAISKVTTALWPSANVEAFGSFVTKLYLPVGDIDLVVFGAGPAEESEDGELSSDDEDYQPSRRVPQRRQKSPVELLGDLATVLESSDLVESLEFISGARVPIIKLLAAHSGLAVDICLDQPGGLDSAVLIKQAMVDQPALRPLALFLKFFLFCRSLHETFSGGVGSYMLLLMVLSFLQLHPVCNHAIGKNPPKDHVNLGAMLIAFFHFYGTELNFHNVGLSVRDGGSFFNKSGRGWFNADRPHLLAVENPLDTDHDIGANSWGIRKVKQAFVFAFQVLSTPTAEKERKGIANIIAVRGMVRDRVVVLEDSREQAVLNQKDQKDHEDQLEEEAQDQEEDEAEEAEERAKQRAEGHAGSQGDGGQMIDLTKEKERGDMIDLTEEQEGEVKTQTKVAGKKSLKEARVEASKEKKAKRKSTKRKRGGKGENGGVEKSGGVESTGEAGSLGEGGHFDDVSTGDAGGGEESGAKSDADGGGRGGRGRGRGGSRGRGRGRGGGDGGSRGRGGSRGGGERGSSRGAGRGASRGASRGGSERGRGGARGSRGGGDRGGRGSTKRKGAIKTPTQNKRSKS